VDARNDDRQVQKDFVEALTTNKTKFFRESHHFEVLAPIVQEILAAKDELRIWYGAASLLA
jgi:chemotaxis protein methyltransferase CheR